MNRRAELLDWAVVYIPRMLLIIVVLGVIYLLVHNYVKTEVNTFDAETNIFVQRLLYSKNGISFKDKDGQLYAGIINTSALDRIEADLAKSIVYSDGRRIAARITVTDMAGTEVKTIFYNKAWYERYSVVTGLQGLGAAKSINRKLYILSKENDRLVPVYLNISVVMPNS